MNTSLVAEEGNLFKYSYPTLCRAPAISLAYGSNSGCAQATISLTTEISWGPAISLTSEISWDPAISLTSEISCGPAIFLTS